MTRTDRLQYGMAAAALLSVVYLIAMGVFL